MQKIFTLLSLVLISLNASANIDPRVCIELWKTSKEQLESYTNCALDKVDKTYIKFLMNSSTLTPALFESPVSKGELFAKTKIISNKTTERFLNEAEKIGVKFFVRDEIKTFSAYFSLTSKKLPFIMLTKDARSNYLIHEIQHAITWNKVKQKLIKEEALTEKEAAGSAFDILTQPQYRVIDESYSVLEEMKYYLQRFEKNDFRAIADHPEFSLGAFDHFLYKATYPITEGIVKIFNLTNGKISEFDKIVLMSGEEAMLTEAMIGELDELAQRLILGIVERMNTAMKTFEALAKEDESKRKMYLNTIRNMQNKVLDKDIFINKIFDSRYLNRLKGPKISQVLGLDFKWKRLTKLLRNQYQYLAEQGKIKVFQVDTELIDAY